MSTFNRMLLVSVICFLSFTYLCGCKGGIVPEVGNILGPPSIEEYGPAEYSIELNTNTGINCLWFTEPPDVGEFTSPASNRVHFIAGEVTSDKPVKVCVLVSSGQFSPILKRKDVTILDVTKLSIGNIEGPDSIEEKSFVSYVVTATGDSGIKYDWSVNPPGAGEFENESDSMVLFQATAVDEQEVVEIQVDVSSDDYGPVVKKKNISIVDCGSDGWARTWGAEDEDEGRDVAVDADDNIYVGGEFRGTVDFDPGPGILEIAPSGDEIHKNAFLIKFNQSGELAWVRTWGGDNLVLCSSICISRSGYIYVGGTFTGTTDFDPGPEADERTPAKDMDIYISRFDSEGNYGWVNTRGESDMFLLDRLAVDNDDNIYAAGKYGLVHYFLRKVNPDGDLQWEHATPTTCDIWGLDTDENGNLYLTGNFQDTTDFDPGPGVVKYDAVGKRDIYLNKLDSEGIFQWVRVWGAVTAQEYINTGYDIVVDPDVGIFITGGFNNTVDFNPGPRVDEYTAVGGDDCFLSAFDMDGNFRWARTFGGQYDDHGQRICISNQGCVLVTGKFRNTVDFNPEGGSDLHDSETYARFLTKHDQYGSYLWARTWGASSSGAECGISDDSLSNIFVTGSFGGTKDFDPGPAEDIHISYGGTDSFLSKFPPDGNW